MTRKSCLRVLIASMLLVTAVGVVQAFQFPAIASVLRFTSSPVRSDIDVLVSAYSCCNEGTLSVVVIRPNGVTHTVSRPISFPSGRTLHRLSVPYDITAARIARVILQS